MCTISLCFASVFWFVVDQFLDLLRSEGTLCTIRIHHTKVLVITQVCSWQLHRSFMSNPRYQLGGAFCFPGFLESDKGGGHGPDLPVSNCCEKPCRRKNALNSIVVYVKSPRRRREQKLRKYVKTTRKMKNICEQY